jgi:hypothetical protein
MQVVSFSPRLMPANRDGKAKTACHTTGQMHESRAGDLSSARAEWAASASEWKQSDARSRVGIVSENDLLRLSHLSNRGLQSTPWQLNPATASASAPLGAQTLPVLPSSEARASSITVHDTVSPDSTGWINQSVVDYLLAQGAGEESHCQPRHRGVTAQTLRANAASASPHRQNGSLRIESSASQCGHTRPTDVGLWSSSRSQAAPARAGDNDHVPDGRGARIQGVDMTKWHSDEHTEACPDAPVTEIIHHALSLYMANHVLDVLRVKTPQPTDAAWVNAKTTSVVPVTAVHSETTLVPMGGHCNTPCSTPEVIITCAPDSARICADIGMSILAPLRLRFVYSW